MQLDVYGKIRDKYPEHLSSLHDKLIYLKALKSEKIDAKKFSIAVSNMCKYEYSPDFSKYCIISPKTPEDMLIEAQQQQNCLASYIKRVIEGERLIFFLREKKNIDDSVVTIELYPNGTVGQVLAANNKEPNIECLKFVAQWVKKYDLSWDRLEILEA